MLITNNTASYYYVGSSTYPLAPGGTVTIPNSVYDNDDAVAKAVNALDEDNNVTVSSPPAGYPRSFGGGSFSGDAVDVPVVDSGGYFTGDDIESVLQELGPSLVPETTFLSRVFISRQDLLEGGGFNGGSPPNNTIPWGNLYNFGNNQWAAFKIMPLLAGTYRVTFWSYTYDGAGIIYFHLTSEADPSFKDIGTSPYNASNSSVDCYSASVVPNAEFEVCDDLIIPASANYVLRVYVNGKNASSSGYITNMNGILLERIGA